MKRIGAALGCTALLTALTTLTACESLGVGVGIGVPIGRGGGVGVSVGGTLPLPRPAEAADSAASSAR